MPIPFLFQQQTGLAKVLNGSQFYAPRTSAITQTRGSGTPTITRATVATVTNNDGYLVTALADEARFSGARRVYNLLASVANVASNDFTTAGWLTFGTAAKTSANVITISAAASGVYFTNSPNQGGGRKYIIQCTVSGTAGNRLNIAWSDAGSSLRGFGQQITLSSTPTIVTITGTCPATIENYGLSFENRDMIGLGTGTANIGAVTVTNIQIVDVTAQTTQTAGEYVSVGVLSTPYHGAGVDGVKYFDTDISGNPIPAATRDGSVVEAAATQYLGVTGTPATQTTEPLGTGTYTLWCEGTGSCIASAGTATITGAAAASAGAPDQFEVTVAGTVTVTVTGSLTTFNLTNTPYQTSYIANTGAAGTSVTRNKDVLDDLVAGNLTAAAGSVAFQFTPLHAPSGTIALCGSYVDANNYTALLHDGTKYILRKRIAASNYDAELTASFASGTTYDISLRWGANGINLAVDGTLGTPHANADPAQLGTRWQWGADGNSLQQAGACFKEKLMWTRALSDSELQAVTA